MGLYHARCCLIKTSLGKPKTQDGKNGNRRQEKSTTHDTPPDEGITEDHSTGAYLSDEPAS